MASTSMRTRKDVTLTITENCNLECIYCYEKHKSPAMMDFDTAKKILDYELTVDDGNTDVVIDFFGGEPFLNFSLIRQIFNYVRERDWPKHFIFFATSNGTLIHGEIKEWLYMNKDVFQVGLSIDGNEYMHNINRSNSFSQIDISFFVDNWPSQGIKMTISQETLPHLAEGCIFLHEIGFRVNCNLAYGIDWSNSETKHVLSEQLMKLIDYYISHIDIAPCSMLDKRLAGITEKHEFRKWCGAGTKMRVFSTKGEYYPCHFFEPLSIGSEMSLKSLDIDFDNDKVLLDSMCKDCLFIPLCPTCYGANYAKTGDIKRKDPIECELDKIIILANSYFRYKLLKDYTDEQLGITLGERKALTDAIVAIQSFSTQGKVD